MGRREISQVERGPGRNLGRLGTCVSTLGIPLESQTMPKAEYEQGANEECQGPVQRGL